MRMSHFRAQNGPFAQNKNFLVQTIIITLMYLLALFIGQNLKNFYSRSRIMRMRHFGAQNGPFAPNKFFWGKLLISFSSTYYPLSLRKIFKKFFQRIQSYEDAQFLGPKWPISPNENFFRKHANVPCFFHQAYLHAKNQSQILIYK